MNTKRDNTSGSSSLSTPLRRRIGQALLTLLAALALVLTVPARAGTKPPAIPFADIGVRATANYQGDALGITVTADGARLRCGFQKLEGHATPEGLWLESTQPGGGRLRLAAVAVGRGEALGGSAQGACAGGTSENSPAFQRWDQCGQAPSREPTAGLAPRFSRPFGTSSAMRPNPALKRWAIVKSPSGTELSRTGNVSVDDKLVRFTRPGLTEEYSVSVDGVRQDFIIESPPINPPRSTLNQPAGELRVELALSGARAESAAGGARLRLEGSERTLAYSRLRVEDATGQELPARLEVLSPDRLAVSVADADATYPVRIDPTFSDADWVNLGSGMNYPVSALAVSGTNLYAGGYFYNVGGLTANGIAKWDGNAWSALGSGMGGGGNYVFALTVSGTNLYAGGYFYNVGGLTANGIAKWDGNAWSALGSGMTLQLGSQHACVYALAVSGTDLYAAGCYFSTAGGVPASNIAKWDGSAWSALGSGISGGRGVRSLAADGAGHLFVGGDFSLAGTNVSFYIAQANVDSIPTILTSPPTQTAEAGATVHLTVDAAGYPPPAYHWYFNGTNLLSCTSCSLVLTNILFSQSGAYTVVAINEAGAVTSAPVRLNVIAPVVHRLVPGVNLIAPVGTFWSLDYRDNLGPTANWETMAVMSLTNASQFYFDLSAPLSSQRFYRAWQSGTPSVRPSLDLHLVQAITLTGTIGHSVRLDYINQFGPADAWVTLATVQLTNTSQLYFDTSSIGQPARLYRVVQIP